MSEKLLDLKNITLSYDGEKILDNINLYIRDKEFVTLLGPSGCGKTTTLRIIGGFAFPDEGDVFFEGKRINDLPAYKRPINTVFQRYALFPHLNVYDNVAFGLKVKKMDRKEIDKRVREMLVMVNLKGFEKRRVNKLSGGQQQRVAIARALVNHPKILLLDEPLGALDLKLRKEMQIELKNIQQRLGITFIYVTHDQEEALTMSDTIVVMKDGEIQQIGTPQDVYNEPKNAFVADFIGESNIFDAIMIRDKLVEINGVAFECLDGGFGEDAPVDVVLRPEDIQIVPAGQTALTGTVKSVVFKGVHYEITVVCDGLEWMIQTTRNAEVGSEVSLAFGPDDIHVMKRIFKGFTSKIEGTVADTDTIRFLGVEFTREGLDLPVGSKVLLTIPPKSVEVVSEDHSDLIVYLESMVYKGAYNEMIVWAKDENEEYQSLLVHSMNDEQIATDIGIKFRFDDIAVAPCEERKGAASEE
ncbi:Spermidine/putrescine import ATP-binding protein PotA [uncultured Ruminococcus sp.]|uniref:Spermidine/putrescine import ATP-binding protein PotA n=1 Tax=Massiliimalia timonensis TaxID=1987501 RepID=A0A8J6TVY5_9FIRM|nr:ABC transporter ATP-binding protein [Massiliimalia timonensis]SCH54957.1 Spermidine/putrescine import ATP-binding protein PotA [uncultured Clostridium sp.]SCH66251.1 Spermidine/putrescine import ATP-binding protein PotA [uncultured Ruminococcus sp.]